MQVRPPIEGEGEGRACVFRYGDGGHDGWKQVTREVISTWMNEGDWHNLFSTGKVVIPEHVRNVDDLRAEMAECKEEVMNEMFNPAPAPGAIASVAVASSHLPSRPRPLLVCRPGAQAPLHPPPDTSPSFLCRG